MKTKRKYFVSVLRSASYDCTNGGITSRADSLKLFSEEWTDEEIADWCDREGFERDKCVRVERRNGYICAQIVFKTCGLLYMFGGSFIDGDSSFHEDINRYPIPVHDRAETPEEYEAMSI